MLNSPDSKQARYTDLVRRRQAHDPSVWGLSNPSCVCEGRFDAPHMGPWTRWAHDLNADVMIVGQDWGDTRYFEENRGLDGRNNPTNEALTDLLCRIGYELPPLPRDGATVDEEHARAGCGVYLTNALLWLKEGGMSAPVRKEWFEGFTAELLREQIELVEPWVVVALGLRAYDCILRAYGLPAHRGAFRTAVESAEGIRIHAGKRSATLFAVYHCGVRIRNTVRTPTAQQQDWERIRRALASQEAACPVTVAESEAPTC